MRKNETVSAAAQRISYKSLTVEHRDHIMIIKFNRPEVRNAICRRTVYELIRVINEAAFNIQISIVVLTGTGDIFTSGNDLSQTGKYSDPEIFFKGANLILRTLVKTFLNCTKVLICLVHGACIGIGFTLSALCDIVYCTETAYFQAPFTKLGICPEAGSSFTLPTVLGRSRAMEALLFGEKLTAQEALQSKFVARIIKYDNLNTLFWSKLIKYSKLPPESLRISKKLLRISERDAIIKAMHAECKELEKLRLSEVYIKSLQLFISTSKQVKSKI